MNENEIDVDFELPEEEYIAVRVLRNAHTHKRRLTGLRKREIGECQVHCVSGVKVKTITAAQSG